MRHTARAQGFLTEQLAFAALLTLLGVVHDVPTLVVLGALASPLARGLFGVADAAHGRAARGALVAGAWVAFAGAGAFAAAALGAHLAPDDGADVLAALPSPVPGAHAAAVLATMAPATHLLRQGRLAAAVPFLVLAAGALAYPLAFAGALPWPVEREAARVTVALGIELAALALATVGVTLTLGARGLSRP